MALPKRRLASSGAVRLALGDRRPATFLYVTLRRAFLTPQFGFALSYVCDPLCPRRGVAPANALLSEIDTHVPMVDVDEEGGEPDACPG